MVFVLKVEGMFDCVWEECYLVEVVWFVYSGFRGWCGILWWIVESENIYVL